MKTIDTSQYELDIRDYWIILLKRHKQIVFTMILIGFLSFLFALSKAAVYEATSSVKIEQSKTMTGLFIDAFSWNAWDNIASESEVIRSTPVIIRVCKTLGLIPQDLSFEEVRESERYSGIVRGVQGKVRAEQEGTTNIINIIVSSNDSDEAKRLANVIAEEYQAYHVYTKTLKARRAREFIQEQLVTTQDLLEEAQKRLQNFKEKHQLITLDAEVNLVLNKLQAVQTEHEEVKRKTKEMGLMIDRLERSSVQELDKTLLERPYIEASNTILFRLNSNLVDLILNRNNLLIDYTTEHPQVKAIDEKMLDIKREMLKELKSQYEVYSRRETILSDQIEEILARNENLPRYEVELNRLQRDVRVNEELFSLLKTKHQEAQIIEKEQADEVSIVQTAARGTRINDKLWDTTGVGLIVGLMAGLLLALLRETFDTSIGTIEDVERYLQIPVLGVIPHIDINEIKEILFKKGDGDKEPRFEELLGSHAYLITQLRPKSSVAESYRTLRTNIQFTNPQKTGQIVLLTSSSLKEGKSTTVANLAITKAQEGNKVLLVNCDLRKPSIYKIFGVEKEKGLTDIILEKVHWKDTVKNITDLMMGNMRMDDIMRTPGLENLHIITCGGVPPNPAELLGSKGMNVFMEEVRKEYDMIIMDCPPLLPVTDAAILAPRVDGVVLVYQAGRIPRNALKRAKTHLENVRANILGIVLNDITAEISGYYPLSQYQSKYYGEEPGQDLKERNEWMTMLEKSLQKVKDRIKKINVSMFQFFILALSAGLVLSGIFWKK